MMRAMDYIKTLNEAIRYIEAHLENGLTYADVAEHVAISPYHFMRLRPLQFSALALPHS